jgi:hypothetical protein
MRNLNNAWGQAFSGGGGDVMVLGQRHLLYSTTPLIGSPTTSALAHGSVYLFTSVLATPFPFP